MDAALAAIAVVVVVILLILLILHALTYREWEEKQRTLGDYADEAADDEPIGCSRKYAARRAADCDEGKLLRRTGAARAGTCRSGGAGACGRPPYFPARKPYPAVPWTLPDEEAWYGVDLEAPPPDDLARLSARPGADYSDGAQIHLAYPHEMYKYASLPDHDEPEGSLSYDD